MRRTPGLTEPREPQDVGHGVVFFFGAGASIAAGVPDTSGFVQTFRKSLENEQGLLEDVDGILEVLGKGGKKEDVEALLEAFDYLDDTMRSRIPALSVTSPAYTFKNTDARTLRKRLHELIAREAVVQQADIGYLDSLSAYFQSARPLDIFSVNYDTCVELYCHTRRVRFTDGFGVEWQPSEFERADVQLRLNKLHGSILWYETSTGACIRIPVVPKGGEHTLFNHETAQPLMLYPARKWAYAEPLLHNLERFRTRLSEPDTVHIVVVGYSFRDEHLKRIFFDALRSNLAARIVLISPDAWQVYRDRLEYLDEERTVPSPARNRVVCLPYRFERVFPLLREKLGRIPRALHLQASGHVDWGGMLEGALAAEDIASAVAAAPRVNFTYHFADGTRRAVKSYFAIRLLEAAHRRPFLGSLPALERRSREIVGEIRLEVSQTRDTNYHFKLDSRIEQQDDGTEYRTQTIDINEIKDTLEWTLREYEPVLRAADAWDAPVVAKLKRLRERLGRLSRAPLRQYAECTLPFISDPEVRARVSERIEHDVIAVRAATDENSLAASCERLCEIEKVLLADLTCLSSESAAVAETV